MKKADMQKQMENIQKENDFLKAKLTEQEKEIQCKRQEQWDRLRPLATEIFHKEINKVFPEMVCKVTLEHIDTGGYWFTFELKNDNRRQTYAIRHEDLEVK